VFFMLIARLQWWGNLVMVLMVVPLSLVINGLRIALIGIVGELYGDQAGRDFHDYSGYITLIICFIIVFKIARILGWKD
jgi:exosortase/archaeosortase family protein